MSMAVRELELILIAHDAASSTIARVGGALTLLGAGMAAAGVKIGTELWEMTQEFWTLEEQASLAFTQMFDKTGASVDDMIAMFHDVQKEVPFMTDTIAEAAFDLFSSFEASIPEGEDILKKIGMAGVAGGMDDLRAVMIPSVATMNAFGLGVEDIDRILDSQFKTVQKGILTYEEYTSSVGKIIPASVAAGQSMDSANAALAFMTRQGVKPAMAATAVARAMELLARPKSVKGLEDFGITVRDASGEFLQMNEIMAQLGGQIGEMTAPERKEVFQEIFGTGSIQARRFFDLAIPNWEELNELTVEFGDSAGAMQEAYDVMAATAAIKWDQFLADWQRIRQEIGGAMGEVFEPLLDWALEMTGRWDALPASTKELVAQILAGLSAFLTLFGTLTAAVGIGLLISKIWGPVLTLFAGSLGTIAAVAAVIAAVAVAAWLLYENWDAVKAYWDSTIKPWLMNAWEGVKNYWSGTIAPVLSEVWDNIVDVWNNKVIPAWQTFTGYLEDAGIMDAFRRIGDAIETAFFGLLDALPGIIENIGWLFTKILEFAAWVMDSGFGRWLAELFVGGIDVIGDLLGWVARLFDTMLAFWADPSWETWWEWIKALFGGAIDFVLDLWEFMLDAILSIFGTNSKEFFRAIGDWLIDVREMWTDIWEKVRDFFVGLWEGLVEWWRGFVEGVSSWWTGLWEGVTGFFRDVWNGIVEFFSGIWQTIYDTVVGWGETVSGWWSNIWEGIKQFFQDIWNSEIMGFFRNILGIIYEVFRIVLVTIWEAWKWVWERVSGFFKGIWKTITSFAREKWEAFKTMFKNIIEPIVAWWSEKWEGIKEAASAIWGAIRTVAETKWNEFRTWIKGVWESIKNWFATKLDPMKSKASEIWNAIKTKAAEIWTQIKTTIVNKWLAISTWFSGKVEQIRSIAGRVWNAAKTKAIEIWNTIKTSISGKWNEIVTGFWSLIGRITAPLSALWDRANYWVGKIRGVLAKIDPREWFSPPITSMVSAGFGVLKSNVTRDLQGIEKQSQTYVGRIREEIAAMNAERTAAQQAAARAPAPTRPAYNNVSVYTQATSPIAVAEEVSWSLRMG